MAAHGGTVIEIRKIDGKWQPVLDGKYNRRITVTTEMQLSGPVAGHERVKTPSDPTGRKVFGTLNNVAAASTAWGTYMMAKKTSTGYFGGELAEDHAEFKQMKRVGAPGGQYEWSKFYDRFDVSKEPNDSQPIRLGGRGRPLDPHLRPEEAHRDRTLQARRLRVDVNRDGRVVLYSGDDERYDYVYKFVTKGTYNPDDRAGIWILRRRHVYVANSTRTARHLDASGPRRKGR